MALLGVLLVLLTTAPALLPCGLPSAPSSTPPPFRTPTSSPGPPATSLLRTPTTSLSKAAVTSSSGPPASSPLRSPTASTSRNPVASALRSPTAATFRPPVTSTSRPAAVASLRSPTTTPSSQQATSSLRSPTSNLRPSPTLSPRSPTTSSAVTNTTAASAGRGPSPGPTPSPEQLVARIRALVRALRDADQLLRALQVFRDQQQLGDDAVLRVMKEDANRTLAEQVEHAMALDKVVATLVANSTGALTAPSPPAKHLSAKVPYSAYGKKSAKFVQGQNPSEAGKPIAAVGKPRSGVAAAASTKTTTKHAGKTTAVSPTRKPFSSTTTASSLFSARTSTVRNGTVITRIKTDPILGEYKVVIRDLTPAASSGIMPRDASAGAANTTANGTIKATSRSDQSASAPGTGTGTPPSSERGRYKFQNTLAAPSSTAAALAASSASTASPAAQAPTAPKAPTANRRSGKSAPKASPGRPKARPAAAANGKSAPKPTTLRPVANNTASTTTTPKPVLARKSFQKKASGDKQQVLVSATLRTAPPAEREEAAAKDRMPLDTPLLAGIFPRYGPAAGVQHVERPFVPRAGGSAVPANVLLPPFRDPPTTPAPPTTTGPPSTTTQPSAPPPPVTPPPFLVSSPTSSSPSSPTPTVALTPAAQGEQRSPPGAGVAPLQTVRLEAPLTPSLLDVSNSFYLGESPWIPIFVPAASSNVNKSPFDAASATPPPLDPTTPPSTRTVVELTKLHVVEATPSPTLAPFGSFGSFSSPTTPEALKGRAMLNDALEWRPSRTWQYAVRQDRSDINLQDLQQESQHLQQHLQKSLQQNLEQLKQLQLPDLRLGGLSLLPLSVAESVYYRLRPSDLHGPGPYDGIPGVPGLDYPAFSRPPITRFTCADFRQKGYFADPASGCQAFYVCHGDGRGEAMLCPNGTIFSQEVLVCDWWFNVDCK